MPEESEGPVFFKHQGRFYVMAGKVCCACRGGSNVYVFSALDPLGPYLLQLLDNHYAFDYFPFGL